MKEIKIKKCKSCFNRAMDDRHKSFCIVKMQRTSSTYDACENYKHETQTSLGINVPGRM